LGVRISLHETVAAPTRLINHGRLVNFHNVRVTETLHQAKTTTKATAKKSPT
jgi:hypothetical protein